MPSFAGWKQKWQAELFDRPRDLAYLDDALRALAHGLEGLARLGKVMHLEPGPASDDQAADWPKVLFHITSAPNGRVVQSKYHAGDLGPGWFETYAEAQHADGVDTQFAGRGGVFKTTLPMVIQQETPSETPDQRRLAIIAEFRKNKEPQR